VNFNGVLVPFAPLRVVVKGVLARDRDGRGVPNTDGKTNADRPVAEKRPKTFGRRSGRRRGDDKHRRNSLARDDDLLAIVVGTDAKSLTMRPKGAKASAVNGSHLRTS
jgi:hypothetical protein